MMLIDAADAVDGNGWDTVNGQGARGNGQRASCMLVRASVSAATTTTTATPLMLVVAMAAMAMAMSRTKMPTPNDDGGGYDTGDATHGC